MKRTPLGVLALIVAPHSSSGLAFLDRQLGGSSSSSLSSERWVLPAGACLPPTFANTYFDEGASATPVKANASISGSKLYYEAGGELSYKCKPGHTTDGSKDGEMTFTSTCQASGMFTRDSACVKASKCGKVPKFDNAKTTGEVTKQGVEYACNMGHSLDGEKVVAGGLGKNRFFTVKCVDFSGQYKEFKGECKKYAYVAASETVRIYNEVAEALFSVSCKSTLETAFEEKGEIAATINDVCNGFEDPSAACQGLVSTIKAKFKSELAAQSAYDKDQPKRDWDEEKKIDPNRPGISDEAKTFCTELWSLLDMKTL